MVVVGVVMMGDERGGEREMKGGWERVEEGGKKGCCGILGGGEAGGLVGGEGRG